MREGEGCDKVSERMEDGQLLMINLLTWTLTAELKMSKLERSHRAPALKRANELPS